MFFYSYTLHANHYPISPTIGKELIRFFGHKLGKSGTSLIISAAVSRFQPSLRQQIIWGVTLAGAWGGTLYFLSEHVLEVNKLLPSSTQNGIPTSRYKQSKMDKFMDEGKGMFFASMMLDGEEEDDDDYNNVTTNRVRRNSREDDFDRSFYYRKASGEAADMEELLALNVVRSLSNSTDSPHISPQNIQYPRNKYDYNDSNINVNENHSHGSEDGEDDGGRVGLNLSPLSMPECNLNCHSNNSTSNDSENQKNEYKDQKRIIQYSSFDDDNEEEEEEEDNPDTSSQPFVRLQAADKKESFTEKGSHYIDRNLFTGTGFFYTGLLESVAGSRRNSHSSLAHSGSEADLSESLGVERGSNEEDVSPGMIRVGSTHVSLNYLTALHENEFKDEDSSVLPQE